MVGAGSSWIQYERFAWASTDGWRAFLALWNLGILSRVMFDLWPAWLATLGYAGWRLVCAWMLPTRSVARLYSDLSDVLDRNRLPVEMDGIAAQTSDASGPNVRREAVN